jgi:hypothetical protein
MTDLRFLIETAVHMRHKDLLRSMFEDADTNTKDIAAAISPSVRLMQERRLEHLSNAIEHVSDGNIDALMADWTVAIHAASHAAKLAGIPNNVVAAAVYRHYGTPQ